MPKPVPTLTLDDITLAIVSEQLKNHDRHEDAESCDFKRNMKIKLADYYLEHHPAEICPGCLFQAARLAMTSLTLPDGASDELTLEQGTLVTAYLLQAAAAEHQEHENGTSNVISIEPAKELH